jgi:predicted ATP-dependent protease
MAGGNLVADHRMVRAGALHRANGGYLIVDARRLLQQPLAWDALKRALRARQIRIESVAQALNLVTAAPVEPEPVALDVKVLLLGERSLYHLLAEVDPDFLELFKVAADLEDSVGRGQGTEPAFAAHVASLARHDGVRPLEPAAVARVVEHSARLAGDAERLSLEADTLLDLLGEADHLAGEQGRAAIAGADVEAAIAAQTRRADRLRERIHDEIRRGTLLIDTRGSEVGQVNALSVYTLGRYSFGRPSRVTARVRLGSGRVLDIEREVRLGGPLHTKGVLILGGFLGARYASERPLSLSATLVFEQSYGGVDGDSASCAELLALLSAVAEVPLRQCIAVTGSVDQHGRVQPVGGVNQKIEGFFDVCRERGLVGDEGVVIPAANVKHLMLRRDVVEAARSDRFHIWPVETVDEAIEVLTGLPAGERGASGFPRGTFNARVEARLEALAEQARDFARAALETVR